MIRMFEIKLKPGENKDCLLRKVFKILKLKDDKIIENFVISGKSIDARNKKNIHIVYNVDFSIAGESEVKFIQEVLKINYKLKIKIIDTNEYFPSFSCGLNKPNEGETGDSVYKRPLVVGFGPAGMFAGLILAYNGFKPLIVERGTTIDKRIVDVERFWTQGKFNKDSSPLFGEGGAGTFSDGKLTTGKNDRRISYILKELYEAGAPKEILFEKKPHIGTDVLRTVVKNIRKKIISLGGEIRFESFMNRLGIENSKIKYVEIIRSGKHEIIETDNLVLAIGHSARDTYKTLYDFGINIQQKPFSIGLRIEHKQSLINKSQYGSDFENIYNMTLEDAGMPPSEYKLSHRLKSGRGIYTFCMCPGGDVITTAAESETICVNGMSQQARDGDMANSALLVDVRTDDYESDHPLAGLDFQRRYERKAFVVGGSNYKPPSESLSIFTSESSKLSECLPTFASEGIKAALPKFGRIIKGFDSADSILKGIESGSSSPVRITRNKEFQSNIEGIYPCGEGAGYAGGITSSALDGIKCAEALVLKED